MMSDTPLSGCSFSLTLFDGFSGTRPVAEIDGMSWPVVVRNIAPTDVPAIAPQKEFMPYAVPCALKVAPLVGKTLEAAITRGWPTVAKMRSASHVTASAILKYDIDGCSAVQWDAARARLDGSGATFLAYSTHSHGREDKPGCRVRVWVPMDRALEQPEYERAWKAAADWLFGGVFHD